MEKRKLRIAEKSNKEGEMMNLIVERVDVWAGAIKDEPGGLANILSGLTDVGADLDFIIARRAPEKSGTGVVFVTPLRGDSEVAAADILGFNVTSSIKSLRVEGNNKPGVASELTKKIAAAGINLHGFSAAVIGARFIIYISFDTAEEAERAADILKSE
jgi:hypothetical protein